MVKSGFMVIVVISGFSSFVSQWLSVVLQVFLGIVVISGLHGYL